MFIKNLKTGVIQECTNNDVVKHCQKNPKDYQVAENAESLTERAAESVLDELEKAQSDVNGEKVSNEPENGSDDKAGETKPEHKDEEINYSGMKVDELRKIAKAKGIQGYANMGRDTLIEVIKAHE